MNEWKDVRPWYNDRIIETIISSDEVDFHGEIVSQDAIFRVLPFLAQHGIYNYWHTNFPIGEIIGWKIENGLPVIRVGIHDTKHSNIPQHDDVWTEIKEYGTKGQSSIEGVSNLMNTGGGKPDTIQDMGLWAVAWVADGAANPNANVTYVNEMAKVAKGVDKVPNNKGELVKIQALVKGGGEEMAEDKTPEPEKVVKQFPPEEEEEETKPETEEAPKDEAPAETPAEEETTPEPVVEAEPPLAPAEAVPDGLAAQVAKLREELSMLASAVELLRSGTPSAIADTADAAEVVSATIEQDTVTSQVVSAVPEDSSEIIQMKKELERLKAENEEYKGRIGQVMEKSEEKPIEKEQPPAEAKPEVKIPLRRGVPKQKTVEVPGISQKEILDAVNSGRGAEYFKQKFKIERRQIR